MEGGLRFEWMDVMGVRVRAYVRMGRGKGGSDSGGRALGSSLRSMASLMLSSWIAFG